MICGRNLDRIERSDGKRGFGKISTRLPTSQVFAGKLITLTSLSAEAESRFVTDLLNRKVDSVLKQLR